VIQGSDTHVPDTAGVDVVVSGNCAGGTAIDWVSIPGGMFQMGSTNNSYEEPVHQVTMPSFQMGRTEVLACQYGACVTAGACTSTGGAQWGDDRPVVYVNWTQSREYCQWAGGRLCSESEWEYAARNGSANATYPWGNVDPTCDNAVFSGGGCSPSAPSAACSKPAGNDTWGVCDLAGNVWEWVEDDWHSDYTGAPTNGSAWVDSPRASARIFRGGSFGYGADYLRGSTRLGNYYGPSAYVGFLGARCCRSP
jgi:formylglycine-generating enzyme required for sulfatase activity